MSDSILPSSTDPNGPALPADHQDPREPGRDPSILVLDNPIPTQALPLLWDEAAYTIPLSIQDQPLQVAIERVWPVNFANLAMTTRVEYFWDGNSEHVYDLVGPYDPDIVFPLIQDLPDSVLSTGGIHRLTYRVSAPLIGADDSFPTLVNVDKTAPNFNNPGFELVFDAEVQLNGVTEAYLDLHGGVTAEVPRWAEMRTEDVVTFYWGPVPDVFRVDRVDITRAQVEGAPIFVTFPEAFVRASGPGPMYASYSLADRAGNVGPFSAAVPINVSLVSLPDLPRPQVPLAEIDGLIDLEDARQTVRVSIPQIVGADPGDRIVVFWNGQALSPAITIGAVQNWPIPVEVPWPVLASDGFDIRYPVRVYYLYERGTATKNSPNSFYEVDLTVAGPDPIGPDPINPGLARVTVNGATGDDVITNVDFPGPVPAQVPLYDNPVAGQTLSLYWGSDTVFVDDYVVQPADVAGQTVTFEIPWSVISVGANPALPVYYWTNNGVNRQRSPFTPVRVEFDTLTGLQQPRLLNDSPRNFIACETSPEPWTGVFMGIDWNTTHFQVGDTVRLYWASYPSQNGGGLPFDDTQVWFDQTLTEEHRDSGVVPIGILPFNPLITRPGLVTNYGSARVSYRLYKVAGPTGLSSTKLVYIDLKRPGGGTCLGPTAGDV
ncbi:hypothetical protein HX864_27675 [Pseudomonas yamanorum]|uniref:hypothetical protein n=1 Tax=Pseudomonas yamanorum TaxID=515393 RepID=UPI0015A45FEB|nr:hypothetical protein [Pseudomonas yamanorum]NWD27081.1 hypothetical protein [Pseudomonas yamanorum]